MPTKLTKSIRRETSAMDARRERNIIIEISPGASDIICFREKGRRIRYPITVETVYKYAARLYADNQIRERKERRKKKQ